MRADGVGTGVGPVRGAGRAVRRRLASPGGAGALAGLALAAAALLLVLRPLSLSFPAGGLDASWIAVLGEAAAHGARWGVDLAFTYGPGSALVTRYFTDGYLLWALPLACGLALAAGASFALLARRGAAGRRGGALLVLALAAAEAAALASQAALDQDGFVFALALALMLLDLVRRPGERGALAAVLAGAALFGAAALAKTSYGVAALGLFALADARALLARRRPPLLVPACLLAALAAFLLFGQRLGDLPAYLSLQGQEATGYGAAMYLAPSRSEFGAFAAAALALVAAAAACGAPGRGGRLAAGLGTAFALALGVKAGFVRADVHTQIAWGVLGLGGMAVAAGLALPRSVAAAAALAAASLAVLWVAAPLSFLAATDRRAAAAALPEAYADMRDGAVAEAGAWARLLRGPAAFAAAARADKAAAWAAVRAAQPLPDLQGSVDVVPSEQSAALADGLAYRPRPSFQEYSTYTAGLIAANAAFYAGPEAPEWVIFGPGGLDDRDPNQTEGALWPELLRRYEPQRRAGPWLALRRRAAPLPEILGPPRRVAGRLGAPIGVAAGGPVFARIAVRETALGRLAAALFRPPALTMRVELAGGGEASYRFIPAVAEGGFVLSPVVADPGGFADLAFGRGLDAGGPAVEAVTVGGSPLAGLFYAPDVSIELRPLSVPPAPPSAEARALADDTARALPWRRLVRALGRGGQMIDGDRLSAPSPTALSIPTGGARRLRLGFGVADGAWTEGDTHGVCFSVSAPGGAEPLWRRCLDPKAVAADRGPQGAEVELPPGLPAVTAATSCVASCDWGWSYWGDIEPEG